MTDVLEAAGAVEALVVALLAFGFLPGLVLRVVVLAYPKSDLRRRELIAELYAVPRIMRPIWVTEQLELALFEGLLQRLRRLHERHVRKRGAQSRNKETASGPTPSKPAVSAHIEDEDEARKRRRFLANVAAVMSGSVFDAIFDGVPDDEATRRRRFLANTVAVMFGRAS